MIKTKEKTIRLVSLGILSAIIIVLQVLSTYFPTKPFAITLALIPIIIGSALFNEKAGAFLGGVFSVVVIIMCIIGADVGGAMVWNANPFLCVLVCMTKGICAGYISGLLYRVINKKNSTIATIIAGLSAPIVNTGIFILGLVLFFRPILAQWSGGSDVLYYVIFGLLGVNFLVEVGVNMILSPVIIKILNAIGKSR
ncbi:MAG: ECF transporter S component [Ruminococcaceae bacterium]|nr:ECF transporter S component [Oscillospiraceae bacterium]